MDQQTQEMLQGTQLTNEDRRYILLSKIRFMHEQVYNHEVDLQLENARDPISEEGIQMVTERLNNCIAQKTLLESLLAQLSN